MNSPEEPRQGNKENRFKFGFGNQTEFHLLRFFTTTSLFAFVLVAILLGYVFHTLSIDTLLKQYESENVSQAKVLANQLWDSDIEVLMRAAEGKSAAELQLLPQLPILHQKVRNLLRGTNLFRIKFYNLQGMTIYSTELIQIGENRTRDKGVINGLRGLNSSELVHKDQLSSFEGEVQNRDLVETYVPGYDPVTGELGGVFEIYGDATLLLANITRQQWIVVSSVILLLTLLYLALSAIVKGAQSVIVRQELERKKIQNALSLSEERWKFALEGTGEGVWDRNLITGEAVFTKRYKEIYGFEEDEPLDQAESWEQRVHPQDLPAVLATREAYLSGEQPTYANELRMRCKDGGWKWVLSRGMVVARDASGKPLRMIGTHADITERKQAEEKLLFAASVFKYSREGIMITAADSTIIDVNEAFSRITGFSREEVLGRQPPIISSRLQRKDFFDTVRSSLTAQGHWSGEAWNRRKNGEVYPEMLTISVVHDRLGQAQHYVALFSDITPIKKHQKELEHIAHYDVLTNLPNRVLLADRLHQAMTLSQRKKNSLAVVFLDLDGFKAVNDQYGHDMGDELLIAISVRMKTVLRDSDTLARIGGDEFVAVLADLERPEDCEPALERLLQAAADPVSIRASTLQVSVSIGVAFYPQDGADADLLLRQADQAMYAAKQAGRNRFLMFKRNASDGLATQ
jgi:diguanylate cyclase (GGDEF)-like protein/PAS domain S-box-containing protein